MLTIVQRGGATREKPPEVVRRQASRLPWAWDGLVFAVPFNDATQDSARDMVSNLAPSTVTGLSWVRDNRGNPTAELTASSRIAYPYAPIHSSPSTAITLYVRIRRAGTPEVSGGILRKWWADADPWSSWEIQHADAGNNTLAGYLQIGGVGYYWENTLYALPTTVWVSAFLRWQSGGPPVLDILGERGELIATNFYASNITGSITYSGTGQPIYLNGSSVDPNFYGDYSQVMVWRRRLTDTELQALVADPYGWYSPRRETIGVSSPYPLVFGGGEMRGGGGIGGLR